MLKETLENIHYQNQLTSKDGELLAASVKYEKLKAAYISLLSDVQESGYKLPSESIESVETTLDQFTGTLQETIKTFLNNQKEL